MIYKKLLEFQKKNIKVRKTGTNPHFKSKYPELNEVLDKVVPVLNEMDVLVLQRPQEGGLLTELVDLEDDSKVDCFMPYTAETTTAQRLGSNNTYNRRYSLITLLGLEDEDTDGNMPVSNKKPATGANKWQSEETRDLPPDGLPF